MAEKKQERNDKVVELYLKGWSTTKIRDELVVLGYEEISRFRVWDILKHSPHYVRRNKVEKFCNFCLENNQVDDLFIVKKVYKKDKPYRMCNDCVVKYLPPQPNEQDQTNS